MTTEAKSTAGILFAVLAAVSVGAFIALYANGRGILVGESVGNILDTNRASGISPDNVSALVGRLQALSAALAIVFLHRTTSILQDRFPERASKIYAGFLAVVALGLGILIAGAVQSRLCASGLGTLAYIEDDAYITLRYARNLAEGRGPVYNVGEHTEGTTNFTWMVILALAFKATSAIHLPVLVLVLNAAMMCVALAVFAHTAKKMGVPDLLTFGALPILLLDRNVIFWALSGLETTLLMLLVVGTVWAVVYGHRRAAIAFCALLPTVRPDAIVLALLLSGWMVLAWPELRSKMWRLAWVLMPMAALSVWRVFYYGHLFPNTVYLKVIRLSDRLEVGLYGYGIRVLVIYGALSIAALVAVFVVVQRQKLVGGLFAVFVGQLGYAIFVGGDAFWDLRFLAPVLPMLYLVALVGIGTIYQRGARADVAVGAGLSCILIGTVPIFSPTGPVGKSGNYCPTLYDSMKVANALELNARDRLVTAYFAGTVPYYAPNVRFLDVLGKNDEHTAHLSNYRSVVIGHNKFDYDYVFESRKPDIFLSFSRCQRVDEMMRLTLPQRLAEGDKYPRNVSPYGALEVAHPLFDSDYFPNRIKVSGDPLTFFEGCMFARKGSSISTAWEIPVEPHLGP